MVLTEAINPDSASIQWKYKPQCVQTKKYDHVELDPKYLVYAPTWSERIGGPIFQHRLVHELRQLGEDAVLVPFIPRPRPGLRTRLKRLTTRTRFQTSPDLDTPVLSKVVPGPQHIVLYSEIIPGNPLGVQNVARWLMYPPGKLGFPVEFGKDELFFKVSDFSDDVALTGGAQQLALWWLNPIYRDQQRPDRKGSCYMKRKGRNRDLVHDLSDSICIDGMSHVEIVDAFNRTKTFYCYDDATMYSQYAAICGCRSVVIPWNYDSREDWASARPIARYGVAYGLDDIAHADETRHLLLDDLKARERSATASVEKFVDTTRARFGFPPRNSKATAG